MPFCGVLINGPHFWVGKRRFRPVFQGGKVFFKLFLRFFRFFGGREIFPEVPRDIRKRIAQRVRRNAAGTRRRAFRCRNDRFGIFLFHRTGTAKFTVRIDPYFDLRVRRHVGHQRKRRALRCLSGHLSIRFIGLA